MYSYCRWAETCWTLWNRGALDTETYLSRERFILSYLGNPKGGRIWWDQWKNLFDPRFSERLDAGFEETDSAGTSFATADFYQKWRNGD